MKRMKTPVLLSLFLAAAILLAACSSATGGTDAMTGTWEPVSYTHLDVYKRQDMHIITTYSAGGVVPGQRAAIGSQQKDRLLRASLALLERQGRVVRCIDPRLRHNPVNQ